MTFQGAIFAAPYLYLIPVSGTNDGLFVRYDTRADFQTGASYETFDLKTVNASDHAFAPGAYDGRYAYLSPLNGANAVRFDTTAAFDAGASYKSAAVNTGNAYYAGSCFDGAHLYLVPEATSTGKPFGVLQQHATDAGFTAASFVSYDPSDAGVASKAAGFNGCAFDGRYLYFEPYGINSPSAPGFASLVVRYDTTTALTSLGSYSTFDLSAVDATAHGFHGATFDGRYLYFAPYATSTTVRFDTTSVSVANAMAWESYDLTRLTSAAHGYAGAVFDGRYVYYVPYMTTIAVRFDAKSPAGLPSFTSSFY